MLRTIAFALPCLGLAGCGSNGPFIFNPSGTSAVISSTEVAFTTAEGTQKFTQDADQRIDGFVTANDSANRIMIAQDANAFAAVLRKSDGSITPFIGQRTEALRNPTGSADATGSYAGFIAPQQGSTTSAEVFGDVEISADFDANTISGDIINRRVYIDGLPFVFIASTDLKLEAATLDENGQFSGIVDVEESDVSIGTGTYSGILTGPEGTGFVGQLSVEVNRETGVFTAK